MIREFKVSTSRGPKELIFQEPEESSFKRKAAKLLTNIDGRCNKTSNQILFI